jgi:hypothetical protein
MSFRACEESAFQLAISRFLVPRNDGDWWLDLSIESKGGHGMP